MRQEGQLPISRSLSEQVQSIPSVDGQVAKLGLSCAMRTMKEATVEPAIDFEN